MVLHHAADPAATIVELVRVLRPGGKLVLTDLDAHDQAWMHEAMADRWLGFARDDVRAWYAAAGGAGHLHGHQAGRCCSTTPDGEAMALGIFVACGQKAPDS